MGPKPINGIIFLIIFTVFGCGPRVKPWSSCSGTVVDDATGMPIADVAVVACYYQTKQSFFAHAKNFYSITETKTDAKGRFVIPSKVGFELSSYLDSFEPYPEVVFYKPGYSSYVSNSNYDHEQEELRPGGGNVISLYPVFTDEERFDALDYRVKEFSHLTEFLKQQVEDEQKYLYGKHLKNHTIPCDVPGKDRPFIERISDSHTKLLLDTIIKKESFTEPIAGIEFVFIKGGNSKVLRRGKDIGTSKYSYKEIQRVDVKDFYIGKYEITREQWEKVMAGGYTSGSKANRPHKQNMPVVLITWECASEFAKRLSAVTGLTFRLPAEQEWEYVFSTGKEPSRWWQQDTYEVLPVDVVYRDAYGVYGINVNVREFCLNYFEPQKGNVVLGSIGNRLEREDINKTDRGVGSYGRDEHVGFRLVLEIPDSTHL